MNTIKVRQLNTVLGSFLILLSLTTIPATIQIVATDGGPMAWGWLMFSITLPLAVSCLYGLIPFFNYQENLIRSKRWFAAICIINFIAGCSAFILPSLVALIGLPLFILSVAALVLVFTITAENFGYLLLAMQTMLLLILICCLYFFLSGDDVSFITRLLKLWKW